MKQGKIYMKAWLDLHGRAKVLATDHWYLEFANLLLPVVSESYLYKSETQESQNQVTLMLTLYLEDCVTDGGNWRQFIRWHKRNYGRYLPFYELSEGYLTDEINKEDIAFLLWGINSPVGDDFAKIKTMGATVAGGSASAGMLLQSASVEVQEEAVAALTMLGFAAAPSQKVVLAILKEEPDAPVEKVIKLALKRL